MLILWHFMTNATQVAKWCSGERKIRKKHVCYKHMRQLATSLEWNVCSTAHTQPLLHSISCILTYILVNYYILVCLAYLYIYKITRERGGERGCLFISRRYLSKYKDRAYITLHINVCNSLFLLLFLLQTVTSGRMEGGFLLFIVHSYLNYRRISSYVYP